MKTPLVPVPTQDNELVRVLGIDPGSRHCGWAVISVYRKRARLIQAGLIRPACSHAEALLEIHRTIDQVIAKHKPKEMALESVFFNRNISSAVRVGEARGVLILVAAEHQMPIADYTPQAIKFSVAGSGKAGKDAIQACISALLQLAEPICDQHVADACGAALCHVIRRGLLPPAR